MTPRRRGEWVSKSHLAQWVRCPYAFWLLDTGKVSRKDVFSDVELERLVAGVEFQTVVEAGLPRVRVSLARIDEFFRENGAARLHDPPTLEYMARMLYGCPDAIEIADGALYPIEIKSHKHVERSDELELAFYWRLLERHRTRDVDPEGIVILRRDGEQVEVRLPIPDHRFAELDRHLSAIRGARRRGYVRPRLCGCTVCSGVARDEVLASVIARRDVSRIFGVGRNYAPVLEQHCSIPTWDALIDCDRWQVADQFATWGYRSVTPSEIELWKLHAVAYRDSRPALLAPIERFPVTLGSDYIALDLEYVSETAFIWLIGVCVIRGDDRRYELHWADDDGAERRNLEWLHWFIAQHAGLPLITWSGQSADVPMLRNALRRHDLECDAILAQHLDLFEWARRNLRLPTADAKLKTYAAYFGLPRVSAIRNGHQAVRLYQQAKATHDVSIKEQLFDYLRDDLDGLVGVIEGLRAIGGAPTAVTTVPRGLGDDELAELQPGVEITPREDDPDMVWTSYDTDDDLAADHTDEHRPISNVPASPTRSRARRRRR
jgi:predicted RecB family nuclease